jgi:hypothetical protein
MKRIYGLTILIAISLATMEIHAQETNDVKVGNSFYLVLGYQNTNASSFNESWNPATFGEIASPYFSVGFGSAYYYSKFTFNWEFFSHVGNSSRSTQYLSRLNAFDGLINIGYQFYQTQRMKLYPSIGAGIGGSSFTFESRTASISNPDDLFAVTGASISNIYIPLPISINVDWILGSSERTKWHVGLNAGYNLAFMARGWRYGNRITGTPISSIDGLNDFTAQGFFLRFKLGLVGYR